ncbi:hypothetical protein FB45DRAFT_903416 [Roridomyces roridus]|uniref:Uncharacterized protein n=1 Tax=Roridomyces roridus TaxID=1738132 RepID=A0AAD7C669_9AGAR|nr:hypothetical protein FB45DRAFT_903416 [Roridomyces roridus]
MPAPHSEPAPRKSSEHPPVKLAPPKKEYPPPPAEAVTFAAKVDSPAGRTKEGVSPLQQTHNQLVPTQAYCWREQVQACREPKFCAFARPRAHTAACHQPRCICAFVQAAYQTRYGELYANDLASVHSSIEADEDASMRPLPPSSPPSPSPPPSSSSYVSDPRTFRSIAASTKPTTLLSIDLNGNGMAHIAQAPAAPINRLHVRSSSTNTNSPVVGSGASVTFSALPPSPISPPHSNLNSVQAPLHTTHHPRNNPRPSSPPLDNASMLTLASSAYAIPNRAGVNTPGWSSAPPSALGDSLSHFGGSITYMDAESTSQYLLGDDDVDASVRALRPRSSRRGSWESEASRWSARVQQGGGAGTPSVARDGRSLWTSNSIRTGGFSTENAETYEKSDEEDEESGTDGASPTELKVPSQPGTPLQGGEAYIMALRVPLPASTENLVPA